MNKHNRPGAKLSDKLPSLAANDPFEQVFAEAMEAISQIDQAENRNTTLARMEGDRYRHNIAPQSRPYGRLKRLIGVAAIGLVGSSVAVRLFNDYKDNQQQPDCEFEVEPGDGSYSIKQRLDVAGDRVNELVFVTGEGRVREPLYGGFNSEDMTPYHDGPQSGDTARVKHVAPEVCAEAGGTSASGN